IQRYARIAGVARRVCVLFPADLDADLLFADLEDLADLQDERDRPLGVAGGIVPVGGSFRADGKGRGHLVRVSKKWLKKHLAKALSILLDGDGPELIHECARG